MEPRLKWNRNVLAWVTNSGRSGMKFCFNMEPRLNVMRLKANGTAWISAYEKSVTAMAVSELLFCTSLRKFIKKPLSRWAECLLVRKLTAGTELRDITEDYTLRRILRPKILLMFTSNENSVIASLTPMLRSFHLTVCPPSIWLSVPCPLLKKSALYGYSYDRTLLVIGNPLPDIQRIFFPPR